MYKNKRNKHATGWMD